VSSQKYVSNNEKQKIKHEDYRKGVDEKVMMKVPSCR
jgi:hypothetical protein